MAENQDGQEKTEAATPKRLSDAASKGQVAKSVDVTSASLLLFGGIILYLFSGILLTKLKEFMIQLFRNIGYVNLAPSSVQYYYQELIYSISIILLPVLVVIFFLAFFTEALQLGGVNFASKKFTEGLNFRRVFNPFTGIKNILFNSRSLFEVGKNILKILVLAAVITSIFIPKLEDVMVLVGMPFNQIGDFVGSIVFETFWKVGLAYILIAIIDFSYQRYKFNEDMKMTKQEVKEETKQSEGDLEAKARQKSIGRQRLLRILRDQVKNATVVITNPTHYAIVLDYKQGISSAPKVVAKGVDFMALKIREMAEEFSIPIVEDPPLARTLYDTVEEDEEIPENLFKAIAQILAYVYKMNNKSS